MAELSGPGPARRRPPANPRRYGDDGGGLAHSATEELLGDDGLSPPERVRLALGLLDLTDEFWVTQELDFFLQDEEAPAAAEGAAAPARRPDPARLGAGPVGAQTRRLRGRRHGAGTRARAPLDALVHCYHDIYGSLEPAGALALLNRLDPPVGTEDLAPLRRALTVGFRNHYLSPGAWKAAVEG